MISTAVLHRPFRVEIVSEFVEVYFVRWAACFSLSNSFLNNKQGSFLNIFFLFYLFFCFLQHWFDKLLHF